MMASSSSSCSSLLVLSRNTLTRRIAPGRGQQVRFQWYQGEVKQIRDPATGKWRYEFPHQTVQRFQVTRQARTAREYEKPWMRRRRITDEKIYKAKKKGVDELLEFIQFKTDARKAQDEEWAFGRDDNK